MIKNLLHKVLTVPLYADEVHFELSDLPGNDEQIVKDDFNKYLLKSLLTMRSGKYILKPSS